MSWYAFKGYNNGQAINASQFDGTELNTLGMHGYPTQAQAQANPNSVNVFQAPVVNAAIDDYNNARDLSPTVANNPTNPASAAQAGANTARNAAGNAVKTDFSLVFGNTSGLLGRIIKVLLGGILLISGILRMTGTDKAALGVAGKAAVLA